VGFLDISSKNADVPPTYVQRKFYLHDLPSYAIWHVLTTDVTHGLMVTYVMLGAIKID
jgi:hypothetical protein